MSSKDDVDSLFIPEKDDLDDDHMNSIEQIIDSNEFETG